MIDAHAARMAHRRAKCGQERGVGVRLERARRECGQTPILPARLECVRRRADMQSAQQFLRRAPGIAPFRIYADGKIGDNADRHGLPCLLLRSVGASHGNPLQEELVFDLLAYVFGERGDTCTRR